MTSKQRSYLKGLAMTMDPILQIGKIQLNAGIDQSGGGSVKCQRADQDSCFKKTARTMKRMWRRYWRSGPGPRWCR